MNFALFLTMIVLFIISYMACSRDFFSPGVIVSLVFMICSYIALYAGNEINLDLSYKSYYLLVLGVGTIVAVNVLVKFYYSLRGRRFSRYLNASIEKIYVKNKLFLITFSSIIFFVSVASILQMALSFGGAGLSSIIYLYRLNVLSGSESLPSIVSNLITINYAIGYCASYILINNLFVDGKVDKGMILLILYPSLVGLLSGSRGDIIHYAIFLLVLYYYNYLISKRRMHIDTKLVRKVLVSFAAIFLFFYLIKFVIGRQDELGYIEYIGGHLCFPLKLFDMFVNEGRSISGIWGEETFTNLISRFLINTDQVLRYNSYASFVYIDGKSFGNVYTAFKAYYSDFGEFGVFVVPCLISLVTSVLYCRFRTQIRRKTKKINYTLFIYAYIVYGLFMMFYSNQILEYIVNISFLKILFVWWFFDLVFLSGRVHLKYR